jgi:redox-sensing transcriptional repressor
MGAHVREAECKKQSWPAGTGALLGLPWLPRIAAPSGYNDGVKRPPRDRSNHEPVSELTTARLSVYLRALGALELAGLNTISSRGLADEVHLNAAQIRKDLANFGEFGVRGVGYYVKDLRRHLREILGLDRQLRVIIMGAGNLGLALADYPGFRHDGFDIVALFDTARDKVGQCSRGGVQIRHAREIDRLVERERVDIAVVAVPATVAQEVVDTVVQSGIKAILNFSPGNVRVPRGVKLKNVDLTVTLESLSFFLARGVDVPDLA